MATATVVAATKPPDNRTDAAAPVSPSPSALELTVGADETPGTGDAPPPPGAEEAVGAPVGEVGMPREPSEAVGEEV